MYQKVFERTEKKYVITPSQHTEFLKAAAQHIKPDRYPESLVCNLYFDTANSELIENSIAKPLFKQKIRLRSYKIPKPSDLVFLELKTKFDGVVNKRRLQIPLKVFNRYYQHKYCTTQSLPFSSPVKNPHEKQIWHEIDHLFSLYHLEPYCLIAYDRKSFRTNSDETLRITVDQNLRSRKKSLALECGDTGNPYFDHDERIMEIKAHGVYPLWLSSILSELKIYPTSFSKVGKIYQKERSFHAN